MGRPDGRDSGDFADKGGDLAEDTPAGDDCMVGGGPGRVPMGETDSEGDFDVASDFSAGVFVDASFDPGGASNDDPADNDDSPPDPVLIILPVAD